jgi:hypothetical protein
MSFEEIQSIWNSQQPLDGTFDRDALTKWIKAKNRTFTRIVGVTEIVMTLTLLFVAAMFMRDPLLQGHDRILIVAGIASLLAAIFVWTGRIARKKREIRYDTSLLGIVERSIDAIEYQMGRMRNFLWWFGGPTSLGLLIGLFIVDESKRYLFYTIFIPAFCLCMVLAYWQIGREIRTKLIPEKSRLEHLRNKLING